jgi:2-methylcitrate dehydratase PrpD
VSGPGALDPADTFWAAVRETAADADARTLERAAGCVAVALAEIVVSARDPRHGTVADALAAAPGRCTVGGRPGRADLSGAVLANAYLMHARLTDDSFRVAAHPGLAVVPVALAALEGAGTPFDSDHLLRTVVGGYECACRLADHLLPEVARRGWRVTSVVAPVAAAATTALALGLPDDAAAAAISLAAAAAGGPLGVVATEGDGWRLQPALAVQAGVSAATAAAAGLRGGAGALVGPHGLYGLFGDRPGAPGPVPGGEPAVHRVTFKRFPVAMYGQSIVDALRGAAPLSGDLARMTVRLAPFAAGYGNQNDAATTSISSVQGIALAAVGEYHPELVVARGPGPAPIDVVGDPTLAELTAHIDLALSDGRRVELAGDGDTSGWDRVAFRRHCVELLGDLGGELADATATTASGGAVSGLMDLWSAAR